MDVAMATNTSPALFGMSLRNTKPHGGGLLSPTVTIYNFATPKQALTVDEGKIVFAEFDPKNDNQRWMKDDTWGVSIKDAEGKPAFAIVNVGTREAIQHPVKESTTVRLLKYMPKPLAPDMSLLWTEEVKYSFLRIIREVDDINLVLDVLMDESMQIVVSKKEKARNSLWNIQRD